MICLQGINTSLKQLREKKRISSRKDRSGASAALGSLQEFDPYREAKEQQDILYRNCKTIVVL